MAQINIDRLVLEVPRMTEAGAQSLALAIANRLGTATLPGASENVTMMRVDLAANFQAEHDQLADEIVSEILRQLQRSP